SVEFFDGSTDLGAGSALNGSGTTATSTLTISTVGAGTHSITAVYKGSGGFLDSTSSGLTETVAKADLSVAADNQRITYGQALPTFTATPVGLVNGDTLASLGGVTFVGDAAAAVHACSYSITASGLNDANYTITYQPGTLIIGKANLTVTAADMEITFGQALP